MFVCPPQWRQLSPAFFPLPDEKLLVLPAPGQGIKPSGLFTQGSCWPDLFAATPTPFKARHVTSASFESISMAFFLFPLLAALSSCPSSFHSFLNEELPQQIFPMDYRIIEHSPLRQRILHFWGGSIDGAIGWTQDGQ